MKIRFPEHDIVSAKRAELQDIPLAYVDTSEVDYSVDISISEDFCQSSKEQLFAYETFSDNKNIFFDDKNEPVQVSYRRSGSAYAYEPKGVTEFQPMHFACSALIKKNMRYRSDSSYNIRVGVVDKTYGKEKLASRLIPIFGDACRRGVCPTNIKINGGEMTTHSLDANSGLALDFIFVEYESDSNINNSYIKETLEKHTNIWLTADEFDALLMDRKNDSAVVENGTAHFSTRVSQLSNLANGIFEKEGRWGGIYTLSERKRMSDKVFDTSMYHTLYPEEEYDYTYLYEDVLLLHKKNAGYLVVTPRDFLQNVTDNVKVIYDVMCYVFFNGYVQTKQIESWITNVAVDRMSYTYDKLDAFHRNIAMSDLLAIEDYDLNGEYQLLRMDVSNPGVAFAGLNSSGGLMFRKKSDAAKDPAKPEGATSYLTTKGTVLFYKGSPVYKLAVKAEVSSQIASQSITVTLAPICNTFKRIYVPQEVSMLIPDVRKRYYVCVDERGAYATSPVRLVEKESYTSAYGYAVAEVVVRAHSNPGLVDLRVRGGGLPINDEPLYNLIDIGNINGRPYRLGSTLLIRLPRRLKPYESIIEEAVKKHIAAEEYPILLFGEDD